MQLGEAVRQARKARGLTVTALAKRVGCSVGLLSQIENGKVSPSLKTLFGIASALGVPVSSFLDDSAGLEPTAFIPKAAWEPVAGYHDGIRSARIAKTEASPDVEVELLISRLEPNEGTPALTAHSGNAIISVISGTVRFTVGDQSYTLRRGDTLSFPASIPHGVRNEGEEPAEILSAHIYPL